jgi:hypothetical protein
LFCYRRFAERNGVEPTPDGFLGYLRGNIRLGYAVKDFLRAKRQPRIPENTRQGEGSRRRMAEKTTSSMMTGSTSTMTGSTSTTKICDSGQRNGVKAFGTATFRPVLHPRHEADLVIILIIVYIFAMSAVGASNSVEFYLYIDISNSE